MKKCNIIFGIDDFNPGVYDNNGPEAENLAELIKDFPKLKMTCFCAANYSFIKNKYARYFSKKTGFEINFSKNSNLLSNNQKWVEKIKSNKNISLQMHGFTHSNKKDFSAEEFKWLNKEETFSKINSTIVEFKKIGLNPKVFCPPGWALNEHLFEFLRKNKIKMAGTFFNQKTNSFSGQALRNPFSVQKVNGVDCIPRNIDIYNGTTEEIKNAANNGFISFHAHVKNIGVKNGLTKENVQNLKKLLTYADNNFKINYLFFNGL